MRELQNLALSWEPPLKVALMGTAMVRAEPIKKPNYFQDKIQKKFIEPPIGVYRLQYFLQEIFAEEISSGKLIIDVFDPSLAAVTGNLPSLFSTIRSRGYHVIGISPIRVLLGEDLFFMEQVYHEALASGTRPLFIAGGNEASTNSRTLFEVMPWLDLCAYGLGEPVLREVIKKIYANQEKTLQREDFYDVPGVLYYNNLRLTQNPCQVTLEEIRYYSRYAPLNIPFRDYWSLANANNPKGFEYTKVVRIFMSNYCPYCCAFCSDHGIGRAVYADNVAPVTAIEVGNIIKMLHEKKEAEGIYFNDDDMFVERERAYEILHEIIRMKQAGDIPRKMKFYGQTRVDHVNDSLLNLVREAGFVYLGFGVESFSDESLSAPDIDKKYSGKRAFDSVKLSISKRLPITIACTGNHDTQS
jgi:hypothetical protein